jgi:anthranilate phosphoribosyltransferase
MIDTILGQVSAGVDLTLEQSADVIDLIMRGRVSQEKIGLLLMALRAKGETVEEIAGAARALRKHMARIASSRSPLVDTCGTGGDGSDTFNISTAAALVAAAAGANVAKHGNRKASSKSGSADVLGCLGVNVSAPLETVQNCLEQVGICFCFAPLFHASMKHVGEVRKALGVPTIFNLLGPLCNPASAEYQVLGVGKPELREKIAKALQLLGTRRAVVVHGEDGLCEISNAAETAVSEVLPTAVNELRWSPHAFGLSKTTRAEIMADSPEKSAEIIQTVLRGAPGAARDIVIMNAAAALWVIGKDGDLMKCARSAAAAIDSGAAQDVLRRLVKVSNAQ